MSMHTVTSDPPALWRRATLWQWYLGVEVQTPTGCKVGLVSYRKGTPVNL